MKEIKDYLNLYWACDVQIHHDISDRYSIQKLDAEIILSIYIDKNPSRFKLMLRPLSDFKAEDMDGHPFGMIDPTDLIQRPEVIRILLSKGFDLFGLIESGFAIDKTKYIL